MLITLWITVIISSWPARDKTSLDITWLKDKSLADLDNLPDPDVLAEALKAKMDINPVDGQTTAKVFSSFYDYSPSLISRLKGISAGTK